MVNDLKAYVCNLHREVRDKVEVLIEEVYDFHVVSVVVVGVDNVSGCVGFVKVKICPASNILFHIVLSMNPWGADRPLWSST